MRCSRLGPCSTVCRGGRPRPPLRGMSHPGGLWGPFVRLARGQGPYRGRKRNHTPLLRTRARAPGPSMDAVRTTPADQTSGWPSTTPIVDLLQGSPTCAFQMNWRVHCVLLGSPTRRVSALNRNLLGQAKSGRSRPNRVDSGPNLETIGQSRPTSAQVVFDSEARVANAAGNGPKFGLDSAEILNKRHKSRPTSTEFGPILAMPLWIRPKLEGASCFWTTSACIPRCPSKRWLTNIAHRAISRCGNKEKLHTSQNATSGHV